MTDRNAERLVNLLLFCTALNAAGLLAYIVSAFVVLAVG